MVKKVTGKEQEGCSYVLTVGSWESSIWCSLALKGKLVIKI